MTRARSFILALFLSLGLTVAWVAPATAAEGSAYQFVLEYSVDGGSTWRTAGDVVPGTALVWRTTITYLPAPPANEALEEAAICIVLPTYNTISGPLEVQLSDEGDEFDLGDVVYSTGGDCADSSAWSAVLSEGNNSVLLDFEEWEGAESPFPESGSTVTLLFPGVFAAEAAGGPFIATAAMTAGDEQLLWESTASISVPAVVPAVVPTLPATGSTVAWPVPLMSGIALLLGLSLAAFSRYGSGARRLSRD